MNTTIYKSILLTATVQIFFVFTYPPKIKHLFYPLEPVTFDHVSRNMTSKLGQHVSIECQAKGDDPIRIMWTRNGKPINPLTQRYAFVVGRYSLIVTVRISLEINNSIVD